MNQFDKPDKATFLIVIIFFPVILVGWLCVEGYQWVKIRVAYRRARKLFGRPLTQLEHLVISLDHYMKKNEIKPVEFIEKDPTNGN